MIQSKKNLVALSALFLVLFIDGIGQGILYPILTKTLLHPGGSELVSTGASAFERNVLFGLAIGIFFFGWFFGGTFLSDLTDKVGRKKGLVACVIGSAIGYVFCALAFVFHSATLLIVGRAIDGLTAGDQPIAQAAVMDLCAEEQRSTFVGLVLLAFTAGLIFGPIIGGFISDSNLVSWFNNTTPMILGALLSVVAFLGLIFFFKDTSQVKREIKVGLMRPIMIFVEAFKHRTVRYMLVAFALVQFGWSMYYLYIANYETRAYDFTFSQVSIYMALLGIGFTIGLGVLPRYFGRIKNQKMVASCGYILLSVGILLAVSLHNVTLFWCLTFLIAVAMTVAYTSVVPLFAKQVTEDRQGWVMGLTGSMLALAAGVAAVSAGLLSKISIGTPLFIGFACVLFGALLLASFKLKQ